MENWFRFEKASPDAVDIHIIDFIGDWIDDYWGFGITAKSFLKQLDTLPDSVKSIRVLINSPGGDVYSGLTIANALRTQSTEMGRSVETVVLGIAASSASLILMAGNPVSVHDNALVMIHNPWSFTIGTAKDHLRAAAALDSSRDSIIATYRWHTSLSNKAIAELMDDDTFLTADDAVAQGFATRKVSGRFEKSKFPPAVVSKLKIPARFEPIAKSITQDRTVFAITKTDPLKKQCFGWASVAVTIDDKCVVDAHEHVIDPPELEQAAYRFNMLHREMDDNHTKPVVGTLIESLVVTPDKLAAMGLSRNALPLGWWVGFQVTDNAVFAKVMSGEYRMFSIAGKASLEDVE